MEVFASVQGEGAFVGEPQVFVRLRGCPLRCRWCDTPASWKVESAQLARIDAKDGTRREPAMASAFQAAIWVSQCEPGAARTVSLTGGEPLAWPEFALALKRMIAPRRLHLETAGAHPRALERVLAAVDHVSLDLKPHFDMLAPVPLGPGGSEEDSEPSDEPSPATDEEWSAARRACLALVAGRDAAGKIVVCGDRAASDYAQLLDEVEEVASGLPVYLTPATAMGGAPSPSHALVDEVAEMARDRDLSVRIVPQLHRLVRRP
jgi:organic radical activating enzyme